MKTKKHKPPTIRKLRKRPLGNAEELERLSAWVAERQASLRERGRVVLVVAAILSAISVLAMLSQPAGSSSDRFILPAMLLLAATIATPVVARRWWSYPRLLAAQRRLLRDRHPAGPELDEPEAILEDLEERISQAEALLTRDRRSLPEP